MMKRRSFLGGVSIAAMGVSCGWPALSSAIEVASEDNSALSFVGPNHLQIIVHDGQLTAPDRVVVQASDRVSWRPRPDNNFGSVGRLNGIAGMFTGSAHSTQDQLFRPWPEFHEATVRPFFDPAADEDGTAPADKPGAWDVSINGMLVNVVASYRRTSPVRTEATGRRIWKSRLRHVVTLELDQPVTAGARVSVRTPWNETVRQNREAGLPSDVIHMCQLGFATMGPKKIYVGSWFGTDLNGLAGNTDGYLSETTRWALYPDGSSSPVQLGQLKLAKAGQQPHLDEVNFNGCSVFEADFSSADAPGRYRLEVEDIGTTEPFEISQAPYQTCLYHAARWYFRQRSGIALSQTHSPDFPRPRNGHPDDGLTVVQSAALLGPSGEGYGRGDANRLVRDGAIGEEIPFANPAPGEPNPHAWGGWHDAGDWDRRVQHLDIVFKLANIVEVFPKSRGLQLNLPESGLPFADDAVKARKSAQDVGDGETVLPDLIHEALWGLSLWRRTQRADGGIIGGVEYSKSGIAGSVSWNPVQGAYAYAPEVWAGYWFVYGAGKLGRVIRDVCGDAVLGDALVSEARAAWVWAESGFQKPDVTQAPMTREDEEIQRIRTAAAATLYAAEGAEEACRAFEDHNAFLPDRPEETATLRPSVFAEASYEYVRAGQRGFATQPALVTAITAWAQGHSGHDNRMGRDYGLHTTHAFPWGRGWMRFGPGSNYRAGQMMMGYAMTGAFSEAQSKAILEGMWFALGCNPANLSFIQGIGTRAFADPLFLDLVWPDTITGQIVFGVAGGEMHEWEIRKTAGAFYPAAQAEWPVYAQIFESSEIAICAEHGLRSNALEWLIACAAAAEVNDAW